MGTGWKVFIALMVVVTLSSLAGCCGMAAVSGLGGVDSNVTLTDSVAVIHIDGVIAGTGSSLDGIINPEVMSSYLDQAASDPNVRAIVLRIDSPGGTVAASQEISTEVARLSQEKPVIASVGDVGASGAYMIASQCDEIWAQPTSAVGSIGVITEIPNVAGLLEKVGVEFTVLTAGEYKDAGSPYRSLTATETDLIQHEIDIAYEEFIRIVAEGRDLPEDDVREMATGWAWSAIEGQEMGLVDEMGTYTDALDRAAELGGISGDYEVVVYDAYAYGDLLSYLLGIRDDLDQLKSLTPDVAPLAPAVPR
jgi:protease-4